MSEILNNLNDEYKEKKKEANSKEKKLMKRDYKEMKGLIKGADKLLEKHDKELKKFDKVWDKLDKDYQKLGEVPTFEEVKEELNDNQQQFEEQKKYSDEVIKKADEMIKQIDEKLAELEKKESLEKNKQDYNNWKNEVLARINSEEYQTIEEAKEKAKIIINNEKDLTSIWEKDNKYYIVLSKDRETAFRNDYEEVVKYDELVEKNSNLFDQDENGAFVRLIIPNEFVSTILSPNKTDDMDLRGKKKEDLTTDEVIVLKKYAYELSENKEAN